MYSPCPMGIWPMGNVLEHSPFFSCISSNELEKKEKLIRSACASGSLFIDITQQTNKHISVRCALGK